MTPVHTKAPARNHRGSSYRPASAIPAANGTRSFRTGMRSSRASRQESFIGSGLFGCKYSENQPTNSSQPRLISSGSAAVPFSTREMAAATGTIVAGSSVSNASSGPMPVSADTARM